MIKVIKALLNYLTPIVLGGLIGGLLVGAFFVWPNVNGAKWWEVFTALGTILSAAFAVYFATDALREKKKKAKLVAKLTAHSMRTYLIYSLAKMSEICTNLENDDVRLEDTGTRELVRDRLNTCYELLHFSDILKIAKDREGLASDILCLKNKIQVLEHTLSFNAAIENGRSVIQPRILERSKEICKSLQSAINEINGAYPL